MVGWLRRWRRGFQKLWHHTNRSGSIGRTCGTITVVLPTIVLPIYYRIQLSKRSRSPLVPFPLGSRSQLLLPLGSRSQLLLLPLPLITTVIPLPTISALPTWLPTILLILLNIVMLTDWGRWDLRHSAIARQCRSLCQAVLRQCFVNKF